MSISSKSESPASTSEYSSSLSSSLPPIPSIQTPAFSSNSLPANPSITPTPTLPPVGYSSTTQSRPLMKPSKKTPPLMLPEMHQKGSSHSVPTSIKTPTPHSIPVSLDHSHSPQVDVKYLAAGVYESGGLLANRYAIEKQIGQGGMGKVYLASDIHLERKVVIKVAHFESALEDQNMARFKREALKIASVSHPNIVGIYDYGVQEGVQYLVMEWVEGNTIKEELKQSGALKPERVFAIFTQLLLGLQVAHQRKMIHRDIKPSNLIWDTNQQRLKILDFGLARGVSGDTLTETGHVHGSIQYMAPEQIKGENQDQRTDLYAVGVLIYQLITGVLPYDGENTVELMFHKLQQQALDIKEHNSAYWVPSSLHQLIHDCLANNIAQRPYDASQCLIHLQSALKEWVNYTIEEPSFNELPVELVNIPEYLGARGNRTHISNILNHKQSSSKPKIYLLSIIALLVGMGSMFVYYSSNQVEHIQDWLQKQPSSLELKMNPIDANATLWVDGKKVSPVPSVIFLASGNHQLKLESIHHKWEKDISTNGGEKLVFQLMKSSPKVAPLVKTPNQPASTEMEDDKTSTQKFQKQGEQAPKKSSRSYKSTKKRYKKTNTRKQKRYRNHKVKSNKPSKKYEENKSKSDIVPLLEF